MKLVIGHEGKRGVEVALDCEGDHLYLVDDDGHPVMEVRMDPYREGRLEVRGRLNHTQLRILPVVGNVVLVEALRAEDEQ